MKAQPALVVNTVFIELTDHLRCPADHPEAFLVLLPGAMEGRWVRTGTLGCPTCQAEYAVVEGVALLGRDPMAGTPPPGGAATPDAGALLAFLGLEGPGGYLALVGEAGHRAAALGELLPGIHLVVVNPPPEIAVPGGVSVLEAAGPPFKAKSLRGMVLALPHAEDPRWQEGMVGAVLPGLRAVGEGPVPELSGFELLASADGWWVGRVG